MLKLKHWLMAVLMLLVVTSPAAAQTPDLPLVILKADDLWTWNEGDSNLRQITNWGYNGGMALSPTGEQVAYHSVAAVVVEVGEREGMSSGYQPGNLWVIDSTSTDAFRTADQPENASFRTDGVEDNVLIRSNPMWSPDGTQLAWTEYHYPTMTDFNLMVYDLDTASPRVLAELPTPLGGINGPMGGVWTDVGILLYDGQFSGEVNRFVPAYQLYDLEGAPMRQLTVPATPERYPVQELLVMHEDTHYMALRYSTDEWDLLNLATGEVEPASAAPEAVSVFAPDTSLRVTFAPLREDFPAHPELVVLDVDGSVIDLPVPGAITYLVDVALSPDGRAFAYQIQNVETRVAERRVEIWRDGALTEVPGIEDDDYNLEMVWAPMVWRIP